MRMLSTLPMIRMDYCPPIMERQLPASEMGQLTTGTSEGKDDTLIMYLWQGQSNKDWTNTSS
eukprot:4181527-Ditylum_brightwellii.AAC.1